MAGFSQGGGVGLTLAEWMVRGRPTSFPDVFAGMDVSRFGDWADRNYTLAKAQENYTRRFRVPYPNEELPAARGVRRTPCYERLRDDAGAVFGVSYGLEFAKYFDDTVGRRVDETPTFGRSEEAFPNVASECRAVRERVGMIETGTFSKFEVSGRDAESWLDRILSCRIPPEGRMALAPMLAETGHLMGDLTVLHLSRGRFWLMGSGYLQGFHMRWFLDQGANADERRVAVRNVTDEHLGFAVSGPESRRLLQRLAVGDDVSGDAFRFLDARVLDLDLVGGGDSGRATVPAVVARVAVTGELGYEITVPRARQPALYDTLIAAGGDDLGLQNIGSYALNSLRLEKGFGLWSREYTPEFTPDMCGLDRFVDAEKKADFVGKEATAQRRASGRPPTERTLVLLKVAEVGSDAHGREPVWDTRGGDSLIGYTTSGGYGHTVDASLAMAYVDRQFAEEGATVAVSIMGEKTPATVCLRPPVDATGSRMRFA